MKTITFLIQAFGFYNLEDLRHSAFGFAKVALKVINRKFEKNLKINE